MSRFLKIYFLEIVASLILLLLAFAVAASIKIGYISSFLITNHRELIETLSTLLTMLLVMWGAVFAYYRFFHGRTFAMQADLAVSVSVNEMVSNGCTLHIIDVEFINHGAFPIREPTPILRSYRHGISKISEQMNIEWWEPEGLSSAPTGIFIVYPQEKAYLHAFTEVPMAISFVTYSVQIKARNGVSWTRSVTVGNHQ